jgi:NADPH-dependent 2,4-dienoyl-CoA reductase/sulfur reductase-like enzyme
MKHNKQVAIIGAGPAGLSAALEIAKHGGKVAVFDENDKPGGQLFKQIHKFFGSSFHGAGVRGFRLGEELLSQCKEHGVEIFLNTVVFGLFPDNEVGIVQNDIAHTVTADKILIAVGASEKPLSFPGWDLPGVMGAGAAQTMININRVLPGKKYLMIGSGNVGLVVSYQILQAGGEVVGIVEAMPNINGYSVHANKLMRKGVKIYTSHTIKEARGKDQVEEAVIVEIGPDFKPIEGTEITLDVDTVCLAVGLTPALELLRMSNCQLVHVSKLGGFLPLHNDNMQTTNSDIYVAGDVTGIEEASTAMEEGRLAGISIATSLGLINEIEANKIKDEINQRIIDLRSGPHGEIRMKSKQDVFRRYEEWVSL